MVEEPAQRSRHRLRLVVEVQTCQFAPAGVPAHLDQSGPEFHAEEHPAQQPQHQHRRPGPRIAEEHGEEPHLQQQRLPAEGVPGLPHVHDGEVEQPQQGPHRHRGTQRHLVPGPGGQRGGQRRPGPRAAREEPVGIAQLEQARGAPEGHVPDVARHGQHAVRPDQGAELQGRPDEGDEIDTGQGPLEDQPGEPVSGRGEPVHRLQYRTGQRAVASLRRWWPSHRA